MVKKIVVTGAAGFLGGRTAKHLADVYPNAKVIATSRRRHRLTELQDAGCHFLEGDLTRSAFCQALTEDVDTVIHCAALSSPYGRFDSFYQSNVVATQTLLDASIVNGVKRFIFISTPSIYFNFKDRFQVKEADPLPDKMVNHYAATKWMAEQYVLQKNRKGIQTLALRPRAIIGAEDTVILPRVLEAHGQGKLKIVGNGNNVCDFTCVRNVIEAILCSIKAPEQAYGEAYNICDDDPISLWEAIRHTLTQLDIPAPTERISKTVAMAAASVVETLSKWTRQEKEPALTRYGIGILAHHFTMDISKAKKLLGYQPIMRTMEGINEYVEWHKSR